jgi:chromosome segregation ATPase
MSNLDFILKEISRIQNSIGDLKDLEGKKNIRPEIYILIIQLLEELTDSIKSINPTTQKLSDLIDIKMPSLTTEQDSTSKKIEEVSSKLVDELKKLDDLTERTSNITKREEQLDNTFAATEELLKKLDEVQSIISTNTELKKIVENQTDLIDKKLTSLLEKIEIYETKNKEVNEKAIKMDEKEKELIQREEKIKEADFKIKDDNEKLNRKRQELDERMLSIEEDYTTRLETLNKLEGKQKAREEKLLELIEKIEIQNGNLANSYNKISEASNQISLTEKSLQQKHDETTKLIAEKKYLDKLEQVIKERAKEIQEIKDQTKKEKNEVTELFQQFSLLSEHITFERNNMIGVVSEFGNSLEEFDGVVDSSKIVVAQLENLLARLDRDQLNFTKRLTEYMEYGSTFYKIINELDKQKGNLVKLNTLTNTIQTSASEFYNIQTGLQVLIESIQSFVDQNVESVDSIKNFMDQASSLFSTTRNELERYNYYSEKLDVVKKELNELESKLDNYSQKELNLHVREVSAMLGDNEEQDEVSKSKVPKILRSSKSSNDVDNDKSPPKVKKEEAELSEVSKAFQQPRLKKEEIRKEREALLSKLKEATQSLMKDNVKESDTTKQIEPGLNKNDVSHEKNTQKETGTNDTSVSKSKTNEENMKKKIDNKKSDTKKPDQKKIK